jgi:N,N'-diacetylchitobiose transport system permease protein
MPYVGIAPALVTFGVLLGYPLLLCFETAFQKFGVHELFTGSPVWIGTKNFENIFADAEFWTIVIRTVIFMLACVILTIVLGTLVALLLDRLNKWVRLILSTALIMAWAVPAVTGSVLFQWLFDSRLGVVNWAITSLGVFGDWTDHDWFDGGFTVFAIIAVLIVWQAIPFVAFSLYAGILSIPKDLPEAARVDGASERQIFRFITFPTLRPLLMMLVFLSVIWDFKVFTQVWTMDQGGPFRETITLSVYSYLRGINGSNFGVGAAVSVVMVVMLALVLIPYVRQMIKSQENL